MAARAQSGLSQSEFARATGVSVRTLQEREQGRKVPSDARMTAASLMFGGGNRYSFNSLSRTMDVRQRPFVHIKNARPALQ